MNNTEAASAPSIKRRKTSPTGFIHTITDLPNEQLVAIAEYLPKTSRALFAVALTAPSESWRATGWKGDPSKATTAVISSTKPPSSPSTHFYSWHMSMSNQGRENQWEVLDFCEVGDESGLLEKLTDDDIGAVLASINAKENLKSVCFAFFAKFPKLIGHGLEPLRGSIVLEEVALDYRYAKEHGRLISKRAVIPILDSILDAEGNSLRKIVLPRDWTMKARNETPLREFLAKFHRLMLGKEISCTYCSEPCRGDDGSLTCSICSYVRSCAACIDGEVEQEMYDSQKAFLGSCDGCGENLCTLCERHLVCDRCHSVYCSLCSFSDDVDFCDLGISCESDDCDREPLCFGCRVLENQVDCSSCMSLVYPKIMEENRRLAQEVKDLRGELNSRTKSNQRTIPSFWRTRC